MAGLSGEAEGTGTSGEDLLPNAALPFELQNHRRGAALGNELLPSIALLF